MKKQTKVLLAATMMTMGASFSAMAALKNGQWKIEDGQHVYYNRDGDIVTEEWCDSLGTEYWMNEDGFLGANEWVTDETYSYYVQSNGSKTKNAWKFIFANDEDAEEEDWYYFDAKGRMLENTAKEIDGKWYYFDGTQGEEGKMLTGWVYYMPDNTATTEIDEKEVRPAVSTDPIANVYYCGEDGARLNGAWVEEFAWGANVDELYDEDLNWYYITSKGKAQTGKNSDINGQTYFFNKDTGVMMTGWVAKEGDNYVACDSFENGTKELYFCDEDYGYAKMNGWRKLATPETLENDEPTNAWYFFDAKGRAYLPLGATDVNANKGTFTNGVVTFTSTNATYDAKTIDGVKYYFGQNGQLLTGLQKIDGHFFYLVDGVKATGDTSIKDNRDDYYDFYFATKKDDSFLAGEAVTGNVNNHLYVEGQLVKADDSDAYLIAHVGTLKFIVDHNGAIQYKTSKNYDTNEGKVKITAIDKTKGYGKYAVTTAPVEE